MKLKTAITLFFISLSIATIVAQSHTRTFGKKNFEVSNHLGNVMAVSADRKLAEQGTSMGLVSSFESDVISSSDYYPYGMLMGERNDSKGYRYGFNGMEKDDEVKNQEGASNTTFFRQNDVRLGRWYSYDPKPNVSISPYSMMEGNPILYSDAKGDTIQYGKFRDRVNVLFAKITSKRFRNDFQRKKQSTEVFIYRKGINKPSLYDAKSEVIIPLRDNYVEYSRVGRRLFGIVGNTNPYFNPRIKLYLHRFEWQVERNLSEDDNNGDSRSTRNSVNVGRLDNIIFNTYSRPDLITITDSNNNFIGGTTNALGNNVATVTRGARSTQNNPMGQRVNGFSGTGWVTITGFSNIKGRLFIISNTAKTYPDLRSGDIEFNASQWKVTIQGTKSFGIPLFWPQRKPIKFNDKF